MNLNRRDFSKTIASAGAMALCGVWPKAFGKPLARAPAEVQLDYQYRTISIVHLQEAHTLFNSLSQSAQISGNKTIQSYIKDLDFQPPPPNPRARSLIVAATAWKVRTLGVRWAKKDYLLLIPGGYFYYGDAAFQSALKSCLAREVLGGSGGSLVLGNPPLKTLAVRSGLAEYGRNNIAYVDRYGSFHVLWAFYTDRELPDQWTRPLRTMRLCKGCSLCTAACPTQAISPSRFVIDAGRCITTYNEMKDPLPVWIDQKAHNALIGCLRCQSDCPANRNPMRDFEHVADLTEQETAFLLAGGRRPALEASISGKLKGLGEWYAADMAYLGRNLQLALANARPIGALR